MTDKIQQARRAAFEEWDTKTFGSADADHSISDDDGSYCDGIVDQCWWAFNAALDCVLIDSPGEFEGADSDGSHAWNACHRSFVDAIESTNLGIKVK